MVARGGIPLFKAMSAMAGFHVSSFASPLRLPGSHRPSLVLAPTSLAFG